MLIKDSTNWIGFFISPPFSSYYQVVKDEKTGKFEFNLPSQVRVSSELSPNSRIKEPEHVRCL